MLHENIDIKTVYIFLVCAESTYGEGCTQRCRCEEGVSCDHVTGACERECPPGFRGSNCTEGTLFLFLV